MKVKEILRFVLGREIQGYYSYYSLIKNGAVQALEDPVKEELDAVAVDSNASCDQVNEDVQDGNPLHLSALLKNLNGRLQLLERSLEEVVYPSLAVEAQIRQSLDAWIGSVATGW